MLISGSQDRTVRLWDVETGQCLYIFKGHTDSVWPVSFRSDGKQFVSASADHTIRLWADSQTLASGSADETVKIWDVRSGDCLKTLRKRKPYEGMNITGVTGLTEEQKAALRALGAVDKPKERKLSDQGNQDNGHGFYG